ncbi:MAG: hypothetical protein LBT51_07935 [Fusobacteriaceae bacterium]|jgi:hypothetical protein|nr:hypothetical protein [Fusobacteriaceae bacterium]
MKKIVVLLIALSLTLHARTTTYTYKPKVEKEIKKLLVENAIIDETAELEMYAISCSVADIVDGGTLPDTITKKSDIAEYVANVHSDVRFGKEGTVIKASEIMSGEAPAFIYDSTRGNIWYYNILSERTKSTLYVYLIHSPELILSANVDEFKEQVVETLQKFHDMYLRDDFRKAIFQEKKGGKLVFVAKNRRVR